MKNLIETIKIRKSTRSYLRKKIDVDVKNILKEYISQNRIGLFNESVQFELIEKDINIKKPMKLDYGLVKDHNSYILGSVTKSKLARVNYGYLLEKFVLKATELNLATCWVGYFDETYFSEIKIAANYEIPSIVVVGYPTDKPSLGDRFTRFSAGSSKRKEWHDLFFDSDFSTPLQKEKAGNYHEPLEMLRLAPSSGNTQPWRIIKERDINIFHFFKKPVSARYEKKGLHDIDIGICMSHFELSAKFNGLEGSWSIIDSLKNSKTNASEIEYFISWVGGQI